MPKYSFTPRQIQSMLNGFLCLFKPRDVSISALEKLLIRSVCEQANDLDPEPVLPIIEMPIVEEHPSGSGALAIVGQKRQIDYSMHPLVVGRMFRPEDIQIEALNYMESSSSGVCLFGLNDGCDRLERIRESAWLNEYFLECELGRQTHQHQIRGKVNMRAEYDHVSKHRMSTVLSLIRMHFKKAAFHFAGVDLESQEAFELARQGSPRPKVLGSPLIYGIELAHFKPPTFKLRIQVSGETDKFLRELVHEIGCCLDSTACPRRLRRVRQGHFGLEHALLDKHFHLESVLKNLLMCERVVKNAKMDEASRTAVVSEMEQEGEERGTATTSRGAMEEGKRRGTLVERYGLTDRQLEAPDAGLTELDDCLRLPFGRHYTTPT